MNRAPFPNPDFARIARESAAWVVRQERGLSAAEQDAFSQWLAADPRHGAALAEQRWAWSELDRLTGLQSSYQAEPNPNLLAPPAPDRRRRRFVLWAAPLAAVFALGFAWQFAIRPRAGSTAPVAKPVSTALAAPCETRTLEDGSVIELNRGARITVEFTPASRHIGLERGEAHFTVATDAARPFVVDASGVKVRAIGTAFNVRVARGEVDVLVTEGRVQVASPATEGATAPEPVTLSAGQHAVVPLSADRAAPAVATLEPDEIETRLLWQPRILDFASAPLAEIVAQFNRHNPVQIVLGSPELARLRLGAAFRSDNVEGFVRLMVSDFDMQAEWRSASEIVLTKHP